MTKFALIYRGGFVAPEDMEASRMAWNKFIGDLMASGKNEAGIPLEMTGKVVSATGVVEYADSDTAVNGYSIVNMDTIEEAVEMAKMAPTVAHGGMVEVRPIVSM